MNEKEVYFSNLEWIKTHDNMGCVKGDLIFKDNISYEEYEKILKERYFVLSNIQLQSNWNSLREWLEEEYKKYDIGTKTYGQAQVEETLNKMNELEGADN